MISFIPKQLTTILLEMKYQERVNPFGLESRSISVVVKWEERESKSVVDFYAFNVRVVV